MLFLLPSIRWRCDAPLSRHFFFFLFSRSYFKLLFIFISFFHFVATDTFQWMEYIWLWRENYSFVENILCDLYSMYARLQTHQIYLRLVKGYDFFFIYSLRRQNIRRVFNLELKKRNYLVWINFFLLLLLLLPFST